MFSFSVTGLCEDWRQELEQIKENEAEALIKAQKKEAVYQDSSGWIDTQEWADDAHLSRLEEIAKTVRKEADAFVLIGVGGSNNAARSVIEALKSDGTPEIIYAGNTLSPHALNQMLESLKGKEFYIDCIAKNFETLEPGSSFRILRKALKEKYGDQAYRHIITTGTKGSAFEKLSMEQGYTFLEFPEDIGGRFTAMSNVGLLPMAVAGIDIRALVKGASDMEALVRKAGPSENPAYEYAAFRNLNYRHGHKIEMLSSFEPQLRYFYFWWTQLFAESEGKDGKGIFPVTGEFSEQLHSIGQYIQDGEDMMFETFVTAEVQKDFLVIEADDIFDGFDYLNGKDFFDINRAALEATMEAHAAKFPVGRISIDCLDAYHFGQLFYFFQFACYLSCSIMGVNPFDQPGVEAYKVRMFERLGK